MKAQSESDTHVALRHVIHGVRRRWRTRRVLNGAAIALFSIALALLVVALATGRGTPDAQTIIAGRIVLAVLVVAAIFWFAIRPMLRRVSDERVALYVEEHEPSLKAALLGAVEMTRGDAPAGELSPALVDRLVRTAVDKCRSIDGGRRIEAPRLARSGGLLAGVALAVVLFFALAPTTVRHGASRLLLPRGKAAATPIFSIDVTPGNDTVPKGADVSILANLQGFVSDSAAVL
ncbi:MAG TPA: hypothetical protein VK864_20480, partial [Longimicrobiales bacterium]|nr:hypothetical protein [Longimicrobiales bacterium]